MLDAIVYSSFDLAKQNFFDYTGVTYEKFEKRLSAGEDYEEILGYKYAGTLIKTRQILSV
ncbi:hypothetical protein HMPREF9413_5912 [Paenibacillus sp. HGF7]|nr:hypothetical protein HMPREF9413_5912 [Paenibacillus sp. HGF7]